MDGFDYTAYADYTAPRQDTYPEQINTEQQQQFEAVPFDINPAEQVPVPEAEAVPAPEPVPEPEPYDEDSDIAIIPNLESTEVKPEQMEIEQPEPEQTEQSGFDTVPLSPKTKTKSKKSRKKRKYEEMETEQRQESIGDVIHETPLSPKRLKLDPSQSTLAKLSQVQLFSDIMFNVRGVTFHGIKSIFAIKSTKLQELMYPGDNTFVSQLELNDISAIAFRFIKDFVYDMSPELNVNNVIDVLQASQLYQMPAITDQCTTFLAGIDNVADFLKVLGTNPENTDSEIFNNILNGENGTKLLQEHGEEIIQSEIFGALPFNVARRILESDNLGVKEEEIFNKAMAWNGNGDDIKQIVRFTRMDLEFLYGTVKPCGILSAGDLVQIYEYKLGFIQELNGFNCNERCEVQAKVVKKRGRAAARKSVGGKAPKAVTPKKSKKKTPSKKKGSTKKKTASKKKTTTKRKSTRKK